MEIHLDNDWNLYPVKGDTGKAYIGLRADDKVFIKRNTTPMLAALAREGITPKLIWTKRMGNGDTLAAQEWLEGRILKADEIGQRNDVIDVLYNLHHSPSLQAMLEKIGGKVWTPKQMLQDYQTNLPDEMQEHHFLNLVLQYLCKHVPTFCREDKTVVHGDVNCRNWLVSQNYLYLVDWDSIMFADPAFDIGTILGRYLPPTRWQQWLISYGIQADEQMLDKIYWYALFNLAQEVKKYCVRGAYREMQNEIVQLKRIFSA